MDSYDINDGDEPDWQEKVIALEDENRRAFVARDFERLEDLWSDQFVVNSPINRVNDKRQLLDLLRAGTIAHSSLQGQIELIQRLGNLVVVMGSEVVTSAPDGPIIRRRFTNLWLAEGGTWRLMVRHANVIADSTTS